MTDENEGGGSLGRFAAILAATIALLGALAANLQIGSSADGAIVGRRAQQLENQAFGSQVRASADLAHQVDLDAIVSEYDRRRVFAASRARVLSGSEAEQLRAESEVWAAAAAAVAKLSPVAQAESAQRHKVQRPTEQTLDPIGRYAEQRDVIPQRLALERAAANERAGDFGSRGNAYIAIIALLAVALFLVGLSLTLPEQHRIWMIGAASTLLAVGAIWTLVTATSSVASTPPRAVSLLARSAKEQAAGHLRAAERSSSAAISLREDYAQAYARRYQIRSQRALTFRGGRFVGINIIKHRALLDAAIKDGEKALDLGYDDSDVPAALADAYFLEHRYDKALDTVQRAIDLNPSEPTVWIVRGVAAAALGDASTARDAVNRAIRLSRDRHYVFARPDILAAGRTALDRLASEQPRRKSLAKELSGRLVMATLDDQPGIEHAKPVNPKKVREFDERPKEVDFVRGWNVIGGTIARITQVEAPTGTPIGYLWYTRDSSKDPWVEVVEATTSGTAKKIPLTYASGPKTGSLSFPALDPGACPGTREYRLDVWASNVRVASLVAKDPIEPDKVLHVSGLIGDTEPVVDDVLGLELCRPKGWKVDRPTDGVIRVEKPDGKVTVNAASVPVGDLNAFQRAQLDESTIDRMASDLSTGGTVTRERGDDGTDFGNFSTTVGGQSDARAGFYIVENGTETRFVLFGVSTGVDGIQRTVTIEAIAGEGVGADYLKEFLTTIRFNPGPSLSGDEAG